MTPDDIKIKPLQWADELPGKLGTARTQNDGQLELFTTCGRYIIRYRETVEGHMWVLRYLTLTPIFAHKHMSECRRAAQEHHTSRLLEDIEFA